MQSSLEAIIVRGVATSSDLLHPSEYVFIEKRPDREDAALTRLITNPWFLLTDTAKSVLPESNPRS